MMKKTAKQLAAAGRGGDTRLAHLTNGEVVVPRKVAPLAMGLLSEAGINPERYQVGRKSNSRNPATGLLEFRYDDGSSPESDDAGDTADDAGSQNSQSDIDAAKSMMDTNNAQLGYAKGVGEISPGTLGRMRDNMRESGYRGTGISDTMGKMGVGYFDRAKQLGYGTALGSAGASALNKLGALGAGMLMGPGGAILGGTLGTALTADTIDDWGQQFARSVVGGMVSPLGSALAGSQLAPLGSMAAQKLASKAMDYAMANPTPGVPGGRPSATQADGRQGGIAGLLDADSYQSAPATAMAANAGYSYTPGAVTRAAWNPVQWGNQYDPLRG
ncbi:hypothetical protein C8E02_1004 [Vogesella indigofera]|uniref:Uncharacterized protein n=1 Tax=Vogesella indigofera TaxID=45465 RepID=A0A495BIR7_VOGIN|nr:hypothetical protein [Vogesella indigofera]RKQ61237.1 hypothetical protein C8E02_1004 [Vogesella indigofera]